MEFLPFLLITMPRKIYKVIDLFAGAGGFSLGFSMTNHYNIVGAIEIDKWASDTYRLNHSDTKLIVDDIRKISDETFINAFGKDIDIILGAPPCQGFSIAASNRRKNEDNRNYLYLEYLRVVNLLHPKITIMENVKEFPKYILDSGETLIDNIKHQLENMGYICSYAIINVKDYGIPQDRKRFFLMAIDKCLNKQINLIDELRPFLKDGISIMEAISDLPEVKPYQYKDGDVMSYLSPARNDFQREMRNDSPFVHNHIPMQHTPKTVEKFRSILNGVDKDNLPEELKSRVRGNTSEISNSTYSQNHRVIHPNKVSPTITASFYSSFIHPFQPRNLTVREAARIQTFPDSYIFTGKKTTLSKKLLSRKGVIEDLHLDQFNQVGNAVPPYMAKILGEICYRILKV